MIVSWWCLPGVLIIPWKFIENSIKIKSIESIFFLMLQLTCYWQKLFKHPRQSQKLNYKFPIDSMYITNFYYSLHLQNENIFTIKIERELFDIVILFNDQGWKWFATKSYQVNLGYWNDQSKNLI